MQINTSINQSPIEILPSGTQAQNAQKQAGKYFLNQETIEKVKPFLNEDVLKTLPTPLSGNSSDRIRILMEKKLLIRIAYDDEQRQRLLSRSEDMVCGRKIFEQYDFKHVKIPKHIITGDFLIERLLPALFKLDGLRAFYIANHQFFDEPVREAIIFLLHTTLKDLLGNWIKSMQKLYPLGIPRYDNIIVYSKNKNGKVTYHIGFIDLDKLKPQQEKHNDYFETARVGIFLFPYQYDVIMETLGKEHQFTENEILALKLSQRTALEAFEKIYFVHLRFLEERQNSQNKLFKSFMNSTEEKEKIMQEVARQILAMHNVNSAVSYEVSSSTVHLLKNRARKTEKLDTAIVSLKLLGDNPEEMLEYFKANIFFKKLNRICQSIEKVDAFIERYPNITKCEIISLRVDLKAVKPFPILFGWPNVYVKEQTCQFQAKPLTYQFQARSLSEDEKSLVKPINNWFCKEIVKRGLSYGITDIEINKLIIDQLKERNLIAAAFHGDNHSVFYF